jgi:beta-lactamase regulating signal transducer with metallopeptidase domain
MIGWFLTNALLSGAALALVLAVRRPVARWLGAGAAYALWLVPLVRLIAPPLPGGVLLPAAPSLTFSAAGAAPVPASAGPGQWEPVLLAAWAAGAAIVLALHAWRYRRFKMALSANSHSIGAHAGVAVIESSAVDGPVALGVLDPRIVVPSGFAVRYSAPEQAAALAHEAVHHRRGDLIANLAACAYVALTWWNPLSWLALRAFRADQELSADALVAAAMPLSAREPYARALVKSASPTRLVSVCPLNEAAFLKRRLLMLTTHRTTPLRRSAAVLLVAAASLGALALAPARAAEPETKVEKRVIILHGAKGDAKNIVLMHDCPDGGNKIDADSTSDGKRERVVICSTPSASPEQRLAMLQKARTRIAEVSELSIEAKATALGQIDEAIARAKAGN